MVKEGDKPFTLINFYATWCKPCQVEIPELIRLHTSPTSKVNVLFVSIDDEEDVKNILPDFLLDNDITFPSYYVKENPKEFIKTLHPEAGSRIPLNLLYSMDGTLVEAMGITDQLEIEMIVNKMQKVSNVE